MENLTRVFFKNLLGDTGYLDITDQVYTVPFVVKGVNSPTFTVDNTTTVYLQPNQLAYIISENAVGKNITISENFAGGTFASKSTYVNLGSSFSIGQYLVRTIQFRYYSPSAYQTYCQNRAQVDEPMCTYQTLSGPYTIPIVNQGVLTAYTNPGTNIPLENGPDSRQLAWWIVLLVGIAIIIILGFIIFMGWYSFSRFKEHRKRNDWWNETIHST